VSLNSQFGEDLHFAQGDLDLEGWAAKAIGHAIGGVIVNLRNCSPALRGGILTSSVQVRKYGVNPDDHRDRAHLLSSCGNPSRGPHFHEPARRLVDCLGHLITPERQRCGRKPVVAAELGSRFTALFEQPQPFGSLFWRPGYARPLCADSLGHSRILQ